jgi:hypothetical protein
VNKLVLDFTNFNPWSLACVQGGPWFKISSIWPLIDPQTLILLQFYPWFHPNKFGKIKSWCEPHDHGVMQRHQIPGKPSKSSMIRVWHKDNLYLGTRTIENGNLGPMNINSWMRSKVIKPSPGVDPAKEPGPGFMGWPGLTRVNP